MNIRFSELKPSSRKLIQKLGKITSKVISSKLLDLHARIFGRPGFSRFNKFLLMLGLSGLGVMYCSPFVKAGLSWNQKQY